MINRVWNLINYFSQTTGDFARKTEQSCENLQWSEMTFFFFFAFYIRNRHVLLI